MASRAALARAAFLDEKGTLGEPKGSFGRLGIVQVELKDNPTE